MYLPNLVDAFQLTNGKTLTGNSLRRGRTRMRQRPTVLQNSTLQRRYMDEFNYSVL